MSLQTTVIIKSFRAQRAFRFTVDFFTLILKVTSHQDHFIKDIPYIDIHVKYWTYLRMIPGVLHWKEALERENKEDSKKNN